MEFAFVYMMGKTYNACIADLELIIKENLYSINSIVVAYTAETQQYVEQFREETKSKKWVDPDFFLINENHQVDCIKTLTEVFSSIYSSGKKVIFHSSGGLNYIKDTALIALNSVSKGDFIVCNSQKQSMDFVDVSHPEILPIRLEKDPEHSEIKSVESIFKEQGTQWIKVNPKKECDDFILYCEKNHIHLPRRYLSNVKINNLTFDLIWNDGYNRLNYLICFNTEEYKRKTQPRNTQDKDPLWEKEAIAQRSDMKKQIVSYAKFAVSKDENNQMSDKKCYGIFAEKKDKEIFECDVNDKGKGLSYGPFYLIKDKDKLNKEIINVFSTKVQEAGSADNIVKVKNNTLITILGSNDVPTINLIEHYKSRVKEIVLCKTSDNQMNYLFNQIKKSFSVAQGYPRLVALNSDITLRNLFQNLQLDSDNVHDVIVNTTPGAKSMGSMLSLWAIKNGFNIWSMDQSNNRLACLNKDDFEEQYTAIDIMKSSKIVVDGQRPTVSDLGEEDKQFIQIVLRILKFWKDHGSNWDICDYSPKEVQLNDGIYAFSQRKGKYFLKCPNGDVMKFPFDHKSMTLKGDLMEAIAAVAIENAGALYVHSQVKLPYKKDLQETLDKKEIKKREKEHLPTANVKAARREIDVIATWKAHHISIECKAQVYGPIKYPDKQIELEDLAFTVDSQSSPFSRMTTPLLVLQDKLGHDFIVPKSLESMTVYILDWNDLCDPVATASIIDKAVISKSTTKPTKRP